MEDEKLFGSHPKDPYKRIECISSTREIRIEIDGVVVAKSAQNVFLYETLLRPRYYLASTAVNWKVLSESEKTTFCPYKGMAKCVPFPLRQRHDVLLIFGIAIIILRLMGRKLKMQCGIISIRLPSLH